MNTKISPTPRPEHRYWIGDIHTELLFEASQAGRVMMTLGAYLALDFDPDCYLYNEEARGFGLDPWRRVEPDGCTQEPGAYIGNIVYSPSYPVFVPLKQLLDRGGCSVNSHASNLDRIAELTEALREMEMRATALRSLADDCIEKPRVAKTQAFEDASHAVYTAAAAARALLAKKEG